MTRYLVAASVALAALAASAAVKSVIHIAPITIAKGTSEKTITLDIHKVRGELLEAAKSRQHDVTLELDVEADHSPQVYYEVHVGGTNVGNIALFGAGIRAEGQGPAHQQFVIGDALLHNRSRKTLKITFRANGKSADDVIIRNGAIVIGARIRE